MPVGAAEAAEQAGYGRFPDRIERDWLGRRCHLSEADVSLDVAGSYLAPSRLEIATEEHIGPH